MECNKDEAARAKEIAEKKFTAKDIEGAKKFALKAQSLYPGVEGIKQFLATLDVYMAAENKINGEADWYGMLGVDPGADDETVRSCYRKLIIVLHPDKNKSVGADGAFALVHEAWNLLSDKSKRKSYDIRRNVKARHRKRASTAGGGSKGGNGFSNSAPKNSRTSAKAQATPSGPAPSRPPRPPPSGPAPSRPPRPPPSSSSTSSDESKSNSFWTECPKCKMRYEFAGEFLKHNVFCLCCNKLYQLLEIHPPAICVKDSFTPFNSGRRRVAFQKIGDTGFSSIVAYSKSSIQWDPFSRPASTSEAAKAATVDQQASANAPKAASVDKKAPRRGKKRDLDEEEYERTKESVLQDLTAKIEVDNKHRRRN